MSATKRGKNRNPLDYYETPAWVTELVLPHLRGIDDPDRVVYEPAAGEGAMLSVLMNKGVSPDRIVAREIDEGRRERCLTKTGILPFEGDALTSTLERSTSRTPYGEMMRPITVITNPPFSLALPFIEKALEARRHMDDEVAMLLRLSFLESNVRSEFHKTYPSDVYVLPRRPSFTCDGCSDACAYAWFIWGEGRGNRWYIL